jgi:phosphonate transport system substrate-binding protein
MVQNTSSNKTANYLLGGLAAVIALGAGYYLINGQLSSGDSKDDTLTVAFLPNQSNPDMGTSREALKTYLEEKTGKQIKIQTTTDYNIVIESIASGKAQIAMTGAEAYIEAHKKNENVQPLVVSTGEDGTLDSAMYYSHLGVRLDDKDEYLKDGQPSLEKIKGKTISFVSATSTSGFAIPTASIKSEFNLDKDEDLSKPGFFSKVMFGQSHQGSLVNLLRGDVDVAAFDDIDNLSYVEEVDGNWGEDGATLKVKSNPAAPFDTVANESFYILKALAVQNGPIIVNKGAMDDKTFQALQDAFTSEELLNNKALSSDGKDDKNKTVFTFKAGQKYVTVDDEWYEPTRQIIE